ncbi:nitric oxide synthase-interacting protein-like [Watersipora subatra]|uniref:nitric oxide synthase-interacting protein-like n=1 Tax=Watersipora subatra TaxID=2589382 RepID=UPI00355BDB73
MGRRHGANCTNGSVYTYHEKAKDKRESGWGSLAARLGKDSVKNFDCCCLTLQPCQQPVVTLEGYLFDKMAIIEYMVHQKKEIARKLKEYEKQVKKIQKESTMKASEGDVLEKKRFLETESSIKTKQAHASTSHGEGGARAKTVASVSNMSDGKDRQLPSFWIPNETPDNKETVIQKPEEKVRCPMSGKVLKMKDLIDVKFTIAKDEDDKRSLIVKDDERYICAVTRDLLSNSVPCAVLRDSGDVVTLECVEKLIRPDMLNPITGQKLREKDIIQIQRGATGFAGSGVELKAVKAGAAMQVA